MTVEDAKKIARLEDALEFFKKQSVLEQVVSNDEKSRCFSLAVDALEKQIPKKPVIKYHKEDVTPVKYGRLMEFHCPNCDRLVGAMYETDHKRGGGVHRGLKGCCTCLQAIDFGEYYYMSNLDDEIELE